jgi:hypothetical protein
VKGAKRENESEERDGGCVVRTVSGLCEIFYARTQKCIKITKVRFSGINPALLSDREPRHEVLALLVADNDFIGTRAASRFQVEVRMTQIVKPDAGECVKSTHHQYETRII